MPGRNARQCKERWTNYLVPALNTAAWTCEEDFQLIQKYGELGPKWVQIATFFANRTDSMVKNRFNKLQRRKQKWRDLLGGGFAFALPLGRSGSMAAEQMPEPVVAFPVAETQPIVIDIQEADRDASAGFWDNSFGFADDPFEL
jgi:hypothetical protein